MRLGVVLGGGGLRGTAHIGVLREFNRLGIRPDAIAGTSSGAVIAVLYAAGVKWCSVEHLARSLNWRSLLGTGPFGRFRRPALFTVIKDLLGDLHFQNLDPPVVLTAFDPVSQEVVTLSEGPILPALRMTLALPGLFSPVKSGNRILVDGGLFTTVPVDAISGVDRIVAVDVRYREPAPKIPGRLRRTRWAYEQAYRAIARRLTDDTLSRADLVLSPAVSDVRTFDFHRIDHCIEAGAAAVRENADHLVALSRP